MVSDPAVDVGLAELEVASMKEDVGEVEREEVEDEEVVGEEEEEVDVVEGVG